MTEYNDRWKERRDKRQLKRVGNKARRRALKRALDENPEDAGSDDYRFKVGESSKPMNHTPRWDKVLDEEDEDAEQD